MPFAHSVDFERTGRVKAFTSGRSKEGVNLIIHFLSQ